MSGTTLQRLGVHAKPLPTEAELQAAVIDTARLNGWRVHHVRPARTARGWRTPIQGDVGFPDLVLARGGAVLHVELKASGGRYQPGQRDWGEAIGASYRLWRPADWPEIERTLGRRSRLADRERGPVRSDP